MRLRFWKPRSAAPAAMTAEGAAAPADSVRGAAVAAAAQTLSQRRFSKLLVAAVGAAGAGLWPRRPERAEAAYSMGTAPDGGDLVNTHLTVQGNATVQGQVVAPPTTGAVPAFTFAGYTNTGFHGQNYIAWNVAGVQKGYVDALSFVVYTHLLPESNDTRLLGTPDNRWAAVHAGSGTFSSGLNVLSGNVGVGTAAPTAKLDVAGTIKYLSGVSGPVGLVDNDLHTIRSNGAGSQVFTNGWGFPTQGWIFRDEANGVDRVIIRTDGNVGIGTMSPEAALHLGSGALKIGTRVIADANGAFYAP